MNPEPIEPRHCERCAKLILKKRMSRAEYTKRRFCGTGCSTADLRARRGPVQPPRRRPAPVLLDQDWNQAAACRGEPLGVFFGPDREIRSVRAAREARAKAVCGRCPVRGECLAWAVTGQVRFGVYGGTNEVERGLMIARLVRA